LDDAGILPAAAVAYLKGACVDYQKNAALFVSVLFHSGTNAHFMHLQTKSYSEHKALETYYNEIINIVDRWAEAYQGCYEVINSYPADFHVAKVPLTYLQKIKDFVDSIRKVLPDDTQLQNIIDEVAELIDSTIYKLKVLK
jgi:DNA-binding ferritin-like protein